MAIRDLIPWSRSENRLPARREERSPIASLQREVDRIFDSFWRDFDLEPMTAWSGFSPRVDVYETGDAVKVEAELPGLAEGDLDVALVRGQLRVKGQKKSESREEQGGWFRMERSYGAFERIVPLPCEVEPDPVDAVFRNGVLSVTLKKSARAMSIVKRIPVSTR